MTDNERQLLSAVATNNLLKAKMYAKLIADGIKSEKDKKLKEQLLEQLNKQTIEIPYNIKSFLQCKLPDDFNTRSFLIRKKEEEIINKLILNYQAAQKLAQFNIHYPPTVLFYGESGTGKTELSKYLAYKLNLPFCYIKFGNFVSSYMGKTQSNLASVFEFIKTTPCVLCIDEIDAIGKARTANSSDSNAEMNRVVISIMQELDELPNNIIITATTNKPEQLDNALKRRLKLFHEVEPLNLEETWALAEKYMNIPNFYYEPNWIKTTFTKPETAANVIYRCTDYIIELINREN